MLIHSFNCYAFSACDEPTTTLSDRKNEQQNKNIPYSQRLPWKEGGRKDKSHKSMELITAMKWEGHGK